MNLKRKVKKMELLPLDSVEVKCKYTFPKQVMGKYQYVRLSDPIMLYSIDYLDSHSYKEIKQGYLDMTDDIEPTVKDWIAFKIYMIMK